MANTISLDQQKQIVKVKSFSIDSPIVFEYFNKQPQDQRDQLFERAVYIGVLALMQDRMSAFLSKVNNELGTELESLKLIFDMKQHVFYTSTQKGTIAEDEIADILNEYFKSKKWKDKAETTGTIQGELEKNKTGDILAYIDGDEDKKIGIEVKFDKSLKLGDIADKNIFTKKTDTAWSQLIETQANRGTKHTIIVFDYDVADKSILDFTENIAFIPSVGFIVVVNSRKGNYTNLIIAYDLIRDIAINSKTVDVDLKQFEIIMKRIIKDLNSMQSIKKLVESNIKNNEKIISEMENYMRSMEFNEKVLIEFLKSGSLDSASLLEFYEGGG